MTGSKARAVSILFWALTCMGSTFPGLGFPTAAAAETEFPIKDLKAAVVEAVAVATELATEEPFFLVKSIEFDLKVLRSQSGELGISVPIYGVNVDLGIEGDSSTSERLVFTLVPSDTIIVGGAETLDLAGVVQQLREAFANQTEETGNFRIPEVIYEVTFALKQNVGGGVSFLIIKAGVDISEEKRQKITFVLCETQDLSSCVEG